MPITHLRGININREIFGGQRPWVALLPDGRRRWIRIAALSLVAAWLAGVPAQAQDKLRVGQAIQNSFYFALLNVGIASGIFAKAGMEITPTVFPGAAREQQALTAGSIDIALGAGLDMAMIVKGVPEKAVAAISNMPYESVMLVGASGGIKTIADLKGKKVAVSNIRGYPSWLTVELAKYEGWGPDGMTLVATGSQPASLAVLKTGQVDAWVADIGTALEMEETHEGRILINFGEVVPPFMNAAIFATDTIIKNRPDLVRRFINAWFDTVARAQANRKGTVDILAPVLNLESSTVDQIYARLMPTVSRDGKFEPKAMDTVRRAVIELGILDTEPDIAKLYTDEFLPNP